MPDHGVLELISDFGDLEEEFGIVERMSAASGRPISISLAQGLSPNGWKKILGRIQSNVGAGRVMRGQVAPRPIGIVLGLSTTLNPLLMRPSYSAIAKLPLAERLAKLKDPALKAKILAEEPAPAFERMKRLVADFDRIWMMNDPPDYEPAPEDAIGPRARALGRAPLEYAYDLLLQRDGRQLLFTPFANYAEFNLDCCREMILSDDCVMGLGDGGAHVGTICDASFSTYLLAHWGRDRTRGERIDLATLVKRQTQRHRARGQSVRPRRDRGRHESGPEHHRLRQPARPRTGDDQGSSGRWFASGTARRRLSRDDRQRRSDLSERRADRCAAGPIGALNRT